GPDSGCGAVPTGRDGRVGHVGVGRDQRPVEVAAGERADGRRIRPARAQLLPSRSPGEAAHTGRDAAEPTTPHLGRTGPIPPPGAGRLTWGGRSRPRPRKGRQMSHPPAPASIVPSPLPPGMQHAGRTAGLRPASPQPVGPPTAAPRTARPTVARYPWYLRFSWLLALGAGILAYVVAFAIMVLTRNPMMVPTVLLVGALAIPLTVLLFAQSSRVGPLVPVPLLLLTAGLGGLFGICAAGFEEAIAGQLLGRASILLVGVIEETAKLVVPLIVLALAHRRTRGGGIVIGIA